ncbi:unnamed protein product [Arctogadus glacialis]
MQTAAVDSLSSVTQQQEQKLGLPWSLSTWTCYYKMEDTCYVMSLSPSLCYNGLHGAGLLRTSSQACSEPEFTLPPRVHPPREVVC